MVLERRRSRLASSRLLYVLQGFRSASLERRQRGGPAGEHGRPGVSDDDVRPRSQQPHQRRRQAAERSAAHVPLDGHGRCAAHRVSRLPGQPACTSAANPGPRRRRSRCRRAISASCSSRGIAPALVAVAARPPCLATVLGADFGRIDVIVDLLNVLNDTAEEALVDRQSVRQSELRASPRSSSILVARCWA